jgi:hypothetical protein
MKFIINIVVVSMGLLLTNVTLAANAKEDKKVDMKCYVELYGGSETIYFANFKQSKLKSLARTLVNRRILTHTSKEKQKVYAVKECVLEKEVFNSSIANSIEANMAR